MQAHSYVLALFVDSDSFFVCFLFFQQIFLNLFVPWVSVWLSFEACLEIWGWISGLHNHNVWILAFNIYSALLCFYLWF